MYVVFEGMDGSGKSTLIGSVKKELDFIGIKNINIIQPGGTPLGDHLRELVKYPERFNATIDDEDRQIFYQIDNSLTIKKIIKPALNEGTIVLSDRNTHISSHVYGSSDGVTPERLAKIESIADIVPIDLCFILLIDPGEAKYRLNADKERNTTKDHYDSKPIEFYQKIAQKYKDFPTRAESLKLLKPKTGKFIILHSEDSVSYNTTKVVQLILGYLKLGHTTPGTTTPQTKDTDKFKFTIKPTDEITLLAKRMNRDARLPDRTRNTDAGWDIYSIEDKVLPPGLSTIVHTGIVVVAPSGWYITIDGRSSLWSKGIIPHRGIIDSGFTGELIVSLVNTSDKEYSIQKGDKIAQLLVHRQHPVSIEECDGDFPQEYKIRGNLGFGSTGR